MLIVSSPMKQFPLSEAISQALRSAPCPVQLRRFIVAPLSSNEFLWAPEPLPSHPLLIASTPDSLSSAVFDFPCRSRSEY